MGDGISTTGKWQTSDGRIVDSEPVEGRLLVAPGTPITPDVKAAIDRAGAAAPKTDEPAVEDEQASDGPESETATVSSDVETASRPGARKR
jgi:hypothetical protein